MSPSDVATLADVGRTSYDLNIAILRLSSPLISLFKSSLSFQMPHFLPEMHEKLSIIYKAKKHLLLSKIHRKRDQTRVYDECFGHSSKGFRSSGG